jgi:hypothetical protein
MAGQSRSACCSSQQAEDGLRAVLPGLGQKWEGQQRTSELFWGRGLDQKRVCTMCTLWALDRVVLVADWAGLRRFSGEWRKFKGWNPVRVPPRAQHDPSSEGSLL